jgi:steroid Delta-isomerase
MSAPRCQDPRVDQLVILFENLQPSDLPNLGRYYADDVQFKDPFNAVQGLPAVQAIFAHMFASLEQPRFVVRDIITQGDACFLSWDFVFRFKRFSTAEQTIRGASHLRWAPHSQHITLHRDYWDAAEELYEKLPMVGGLMRWLRRRVNRL